MKKSEWRNPGEDEKRHILYWIKRERINNIIVSLCLFLVPFLGFAAYDAGAYLFKPEYFGFGIKYTLIFSPLLIFLGCFCLYIIICENEKVRIASNGECLIIEAIVQYAGKKRMGRYAYMKVVSALFHDDFKPETKDFPVSQAILKKTHKGDSGWLIKFPQGKGLNKKKIIFVPNNK